MEGTGRLHEFAENETVKAAIQACRKAHAVVFEAEVVKCRSLGSLARRRAYSKHVLNLRESQTPDELVHPALLAYGLEAAK
jgi:hypothetical protein